MQVLGSYELEKYQTEKFEPIIYDIYHNILILTWALCEGTFFMP